MLGKDIKKIQSAEGKAKEIIKSAHLEVEDKFTSLNSTINSYREEKQSVYDDLKDKMYKDADLFILKYKEEKEKESEEVINKIKNLSHAHSEKAIQFILDNLV